MFRILKFENIVVIFCVLPGAIAVLVSPVLPVIEENISFLSKVCSNTIQLSKQMSFHVVTLNPNFDFTPLIRDFYENSVSTIVADHLSDSEIFLTPERTKNIFFILNDFSDILNLILGSVSYHGQPQKPSKVYLNTSLTFTHGKDREPCSRMPQFPNYCIRHKPGSGILYRDRKRGCDETIEMSEEDLKEDSTIPDAIFRHTRGLYLHDIWNSHNYLLLVVLKLNYKQPHLDFSGIFQTGTSLNLQQSSFKQMKRNCDPAFSQTGLSMNLQRKWTMRDCDFTTLERSISLDLQRRSSKRMKKNCDVAFFQTNMSLNLQQNFSKWMKNDCDLAALGVSLNLQQNSDEWMKNSSDIHSKMLFVFKFIWRTFKGHKAVICLDKACYRYDPFYPKMFEFTARSADYFNFSWFSLNRKPFSTFLALGPVNKIIEHSSDGGHGFWDLFMTAALNIFANKRKALFKLKSNYMRNGTQILNPHDYEFGLKNGIDFYIIGSDVGVKGIDFQKFDFSPTLDTEMMYFIVPRRGFIPQYLAAFRCFTPVVWVCVLAMFVIFLMTQFIYKRLQTKTFRRLYTEKELLQYECLPPVITIYRYFICGGQPRLLLGNLITGKILFAVFVFSAMILTTTFQSKLLTLLSQRVRYSDIDTFKDLEESNLFVQTSDLDTDRKYFSREASFGRISERLTDTFNNEIPFVYGDISIYRLL